MQEIVDRSQNQRQVDDRNVGELPHHGSLNSGGCRARSGSGDQDVKLGSLLQHPRWKDHEKVGLDLAPVHSADTTHPGSEQHSLDIKNQLVSQAGFQAARNPFVQRDKRRLVPLTFPNRPPSQQQFLVLQQPSPIGGPVFPSQGPRRNGVSRIPQPLGDAFSPDRV